MEINPYAIYQSAQTDTTSEVTNSLGKDDFLKILAAQFQGQNPLEPVNDTEFIAQMAQFSSLEQLYNIAEKLEVFEEDLVWSQHLSLLGKELVAVTADGDEITGTVTGVSFRDGQFQFEIDGQEVDIAAIVSVGVPEPEPIVVMLPEDTGTDGEDVQNDETGDAGTGDGEAVDR